MNKYFSSVQKRLKDTPPPIQREVVKEDLKTSIQKRLLREALRSPVVGEPDEAVSAEFSPEPEELGPEAGAEDVVGDQEEAPKIDLDAVPEPEPTREPSRSAQDVDPADKEETLIAIVDKSRESHDDLMSMSGLAASPELNDWTTRAKIDALTKEVNRIHNKFNDELGSMGGEKGKEYLETEQKPEVEEVEEPVEEPTKPETKRQPGMETELLELEDVNFIAKAITEDPDIPDE